jgi:hypothetical protein
VQFLYPKAIPEGADYKILAIEITSARKSKISEFKKFRTLSSSTLTEQKVQDGSCLQRKSDLFEGFYTQCEFYNSSGLVYISVRSRKAIDSSVTTELRKLIAGRESIHADADCAH